jgi:hypothetical protein
MNFAFFLSGVSMATFAASGLFFLKFWIASRDRFFILFSAACFILAFERVVLTIVQQSHGAEHMIVESSSWVYLLRLSAFAMIFWAILEKNRKSENQLK